MKNYDFKNWRQITCILPIYDQFGCNSTLIHFSNDEKIDYQYRTKTVIKRLAEYFTIDLIALRKKCGGMVGRKSSSPLPLRQDFTLIPLKIRQPLGKDQGSQGFVVFEQIKEIKSLGKQRTLIIFNNEFSIECLQAIESVNLLINHAKIIRSNVHVDMVKESKCNGYSSCSVLKVLLNTIMAENNK